jgi:hypothetical protein
MVLDVGGDGAVHYLADEPPASVRIAADRVELEYAWEGGQKVDSPWLEDFQETTTDPGRASTG